MQLFIGVRYLLLAPLYGYSLEALALEADETPSSRCCTTASRRRSDLEEFRARLRSHVREELDRVQRGAGRGAIDLGKVGEAEEAAAGGDHVRVLELLGSWPAPLAIFLRTPEGQLLTPETRGADRARGWGCSAAPASRWAR